MTITSAPAEARDDDRELSPWVSFGLRRLTRFLVSLWVLVTFSFLIIHLTPGDPIRAALGPRTPTAIIEARREQLGLDDPLIQQYLHYIQGLFHGDLGISFQSQLPVSEIISDRLPNTLSLAFAAFLVIVLIGVPAGLLIAVVTQGGKRRGTELVATSTATVLGTIPDFLVAIVLVAVFAVSLAWLPIAGESGPASYVIPVVALAVGPAAGLARIVRVETLGVLQTDYIRTARAKRLRPRRVYLRHALPNAMTATLTVSGLLLAGLVAGTVLVEQVVAWPGLGPTLTGAILNKDYPLAQGIVLVYGSLVLVINLAVDLALVMLDPRSTLRES